MIEYIKQIFCIHNYYIPTEYDDKEERQKIKSELKKGEGTNFIRLHRCKKCGNEKMIGSGIIF
jgi:hypothetical protein